MQVSFRNTQTAVPQTTTPQAVAGEQKSRGVFDTTREAWKTTLKTKETACAYTSGFFRGLKNAAYAGAALVGLDWFATSCVNISKGKNNIGHMLATPFAVAGKTIGKTAKYLVDFCKKDGPTVPQALKALVWDAPKKVLGKVYRSQNISKVAKYGLPIIALAVAGYTTFRSCLDANERSSKIDHRYGGEMGHHKA